MRISKQSTRVYGTLLRSYSALTRAQPSRIVSEFRALQAQSREANAYRVQVVEEETQVEGAPNPMQEGESRIGQQVGSQTSQARFPSRKTKRLPHQNPGFLPRLAYEVAEASDGNSGSVTSQGQPLTCQFSLD